MKHLDLTIDYMENSRFNCLYGPMVTHMKSSRFTDIELLCITMIYHKFTTQKGKDVKYMSVEQLRKCLLILFKISDKRINERVIRTICVDPDNHDPNYSPIHHCSLNCFIRLFTIYFSRDLEERMQFVFNVCRLYLNIFFPNPNYSSIRCTTRIQSAI